MFKKILAIGALLLVGVCAGAAEPDRHFINGPRKPDSAPLPFSDAVLAGDTLYIAGHLGLDPKTDRAAADPRDEARLVMDGIQKTVEAAGLTMDDVVSMQIYCTDLALYGTFNEIYRTYFPHGFPARAFLGASALVRGARFEVLGIAVRKTPQK